MCFCGILELLVTAVKCEFNWEVLVLILVQLLRLAMAYPAATAACERSFRLRKITKTDARSTMSCKRFNHLRILKHHKEILKKEVDLPESMNEFASRHQSRKKYFGEIPAKKKMKHAREPNGDVSMCRFNCAAFTKLICFFME